MHVRYIPISEGMLLGQPDFLTGMYHIGTMSETVCQNECIADYNTQTIQCRNCRACRLQPWVGMTTTALTSLSKPSPTEVERLFEVDHHVAQVVHHPTVIITVVCAQPMLACLHVLPNTPPVWYIPVSKDLLLQAVHTASQNGMCHTGRNVREGLQCVADYYTHTVHCRACQKLPTGMSRPLAANTWPRCGRLPATWLKVYSRCTPSRWLYPPHATLLSYKASCPAQHCFDFRLTSQKVPSWRATVIITPTWQVGVV